MPLLRFKSDEGNSYPDWEEDNIGSIGVCIAGATPSTKNKDFWENGTIPWLSSGEVNKRKIFDTDKKITQLGYDNSSTKMVKANSVIIAMAGQGKTRGMAGITRIPLCTNQSLCSIETNERVISDYLYQHLLTRYMDLRNLSSGDDTRGGLNLEIIRNFEVVFPSSLEEQQKIADFLSDVDAQIENYQQSLNNLEAQKKELLRQIFSQELRFTREDGSDYPDWEEILVQEVCDVNPKSESLNPEFYYIDIESVVKGRLVKNQIIPKTNAPSRAKRTLMLNDVLFQTVRPYQMDHYHFTKLRDRQVVASTGFAQLRIKQGYPAYLYQLLYSPLFNEEVANRCTGSSYPAINAEALKSVPVTVATSIEEQQKIADFFSDFDKRIELERQRLQTMQELKKGLLQQMFC